MLSILCFILKVLEFGVKMIDTAIASNVFAAFNHPTDQMSMNRYNRFPRKGWGELEKYLHREGNDALVEL